MLQPSTPGKVKKIAGKKVKKKNFDIIFGQFILSNICNRSLLEKGKILKMKNINSILILSKYNGNHDVIKDNDDCADLCKSRLACASSPRHLYILPALEYLSLN